MKTPLFAMITLFVAAFACASDSNSFEMRAVAEASAPSPRAYFLPPRNGQVEKVLLDSAVLLDQSALKRASVQHDPDGKVSILIEMTPTGGKRFAEITSSHLGKRIGIVLDGQLYSAPMVRDPILGGKVSISGDLSEAEAADLVQKLNKKP